MYTVIQEMRGASGERLILHGPNIINLCIDDYGREKQCGRLYHQYTDQKMSFSTLFEALEKMEQLYDELQFPQATTRIRSFIPEQNAGGGKRRTAAEPGRACGAEEAEAAGRERARSRRVGPKVCTELRQRNQPQRRNSHFPYLCTIQTILQLAGTADLDGGKEAPDFPQRGGIAPAHG